VVRVAGQFADVSGDARYVAILAVAEPVLQCTAVMGLLSRFAREDVGADALRLLGMAAHAAGDPVRSVAFLGRAETMLRDTGRLGLLSQVLSMQVIDRLELGEWDRAAAVAAEGTRLAAETGQPIWRAGTLVCDAMIHAFRGQAEQAFRYAAVRAGERGDARMIIADLERVAAVTPAPLLHIHLRYARAVLADDTDAGAALC